MDRSTISEVSQQFGVSTRTLRYYEEIGLIESTRGIDYAYRTYDEEAIQRLQQIIVLRQLRIPLKQIRHLLLGASVTASLRIFVATLTEVTEEMEALVTLRVALQTVIDALQRERLPEDRLRASGTVIERILEMIPYALANPDPPSIATSHQGEKEMDTLRTASRTSQRIQDVRIITLPPATVAAIRAVGGEPEGDTEAALRRFVEETDLFAVKPDSRHYGFNHPNGEKPDGSDHGYERWVTIPDDMPVPAPFVKKHFAGGLYAAHMIPMGAFEEWRLLDEWIRTSDTYEYRTGDPDCMGGCLEEHLNCVETHKMEPDACDGGIQLDLLIPIQRNSTSRAC